MQNREGVQKGPQDHAEGQHGSKTHSKFLEQLQSGNNGGTPANSENESDKLKNPAHHNANHRLFEERQQHDEAEKKSEKTRLHRELERGHHELPTPKI